MLSPDNSDLYICNGQNGSIGSYKINTIDGSISDNYTTYTTNGVFPSGLAFNNTKSLYAVNQLSNNYTVYNSTNYFNLTSPNTEIDASESAPQGIVFTADGDFAFVAQSGANAINIYDVGTDGLLNFDSSFKTDGSPSALAISASGDYLFVANQTKNTIMTYAINQSNTSITLTYLESTISGNYPSGLTTAMFKSQ